MKTSKLRRLAALGALFTFTLAAAAQCGSTTDPSSNPAKPCPHGYVRHLESNFSSKPYVCEKL